LCRVIFLGLIRKGELPIRIQPKGRGEGRKTAGGDLKAG
jgi:hypothetical protein